MGGDETRLRYVRFVQGNQPNVPAHTMCRHVKTPKLVYQTPILVFFNSKNVYKIGNWFLVLETPILVFQASKRGA